VLWSIVICVAVKYSIEVRPTVPARLLPYGFDMEEFELEVLAEECDPDPTIASVSGTAVRTGSTTSGQVGSGRSGQGRNQGQGHGQGQNQGQGHSQGQVQSQVQGQGQGQSQGQGQGQGQRSSGSGQSGNLQTKPSYPKPPHVFGSSRILINEFDIADQFIELKKLSTVVKGGRQERTSASCRTTLDGYHALIIKANAAQLHIVSSINLEDFKLNANGFYVLDGGITTVANYVSALNAFLPGDGDAYMFCLVYISSRAPAGKKSIVRLSGSRNQPQQSKLLSDGDVDFITESIQDAIVFGIDCSVEANADKCDMFHKIWAGFKLMKGDFSIVQPPYTQGVSINRCCDNLKPLSPSNFKTGPPTPWMENICDEDMDPVITDNVMRTPEHYRLRLPFRFGETGSAPFQTQAKK